MSDNYLKLLPRDPFWRPSSQAIEKSLEVLRSFVPAAENVSAEITDQVTFFDAGSNTDKINCPSCGESIKHWWATPWT